MPSSDADHVIDLLREGHDDLAAIASGLSNDQITGPSGASDWDVSQVLGHLGSGAEIARAGLEATVAGDPPPAGDFNQSVWDRWDAMASSERVAAFVEADEAYVAMLEALGPDVRRDLRVSLPWLPEPVDLATVLMFRLSEATFHSWDVRVGLDADATLRPGPVGLLADRMAPQFAFLGQAAAMDATVAVAVTTSEPDRAFLLTVGEGVTVEPVGADDADASEGADGVLRAPAEAWMRLLTGRLGPGRTPATVSLDAADVTLDDLRRVFPGF